MVINESEAFQVFQGFNTLPPADQPRAAKMLADYRQQQERLGAPLWPSQEDAKRRQYERAREVIFDPLKLDAENGAYVQADRVAPGTGDKMRQRDAAIAWTATKYQVPEQQVREKWPAYKADLGSKWGTGVLDDTAFFSRAKQEQQKEDARIDLYKSAQDAAFQSAIAGGDDLADFGNWQATQDNEEAWQDATHQIWSKTRREIAEAIGPNRELIAKAPEAMRRLQTGAATDADRETLDRLAWTVTDATGKQRQVMLRALAHGVRKVAEEQGKQGVGATFTVSAERLVEDMFGGGRIGESTAAKLDPTQPLPVGPITNLDDATRALDMLAKAEFAKRVPFDPDAPELPEARQLTPEEQALMQQAKERISNLFKTERELKRLARESTPLAPTYGELRAEGAGFFEALARGGMGSAVSGTATTLSLVAPLTLGWPGAVLVGGGYANMEYEQLLTEYPDMSAEDAARVAVLSGGIQAALDKATLFGLARFSPNLRKLLTGNATRELVKQAVGKTAGLVTFENFIEGLQDVTTPAVQSVLSDLENTIPAVDWQREYREFADSRADVFIGMLPLMLIGAGVNTARNREQAKALMSDNDALARAGYIESDRIAAIEKAQAGDIEGAAAVLEEGFDRRSPELAAEMGNEQAAKAINDWQTVRQAAEAGVIPRIRRDGNGWAVEQNGAFVKVGSRDEALRIALSAVDENARTEAEALAKVAEAYSSGQDVLDLQLGTVRRLQDEGLSEQQVREFAVAEGMVNGLTREEAEQATWYVMGKNQLETKEGVRRAVVSLYRGASVLDAVEEPVEARLKLAWESGALTREQTLDWIRTAAEIMGAPELVTAAESGNNGMIEAVSDIVLADVFGQRRDGRKGVAGAVTAGIKAKLRQNVTSKTASQFGQFLAAFRAFFAQVFRRARALAKARKEGRIGEDFDAFLDTVMGTPAQQRFEAETVKEGFAMLQDMMPDMPAMEGQPYSFSLSRVNESHFEQAGKFYRVITGEKAFNDIATTGLVRTNAQSKEKGAGLLASIADRPTAFPSFSKDKAALSYARENPDHYIIVTESNALKPSTQGRHGKGTTYFPTSENGTALQSLPATETQVFKHIGNGQYELVLDRGKLIADSASFSLSRNPVDVADTFLAERMRSPEFREIYFNAARDRLARLRKTKSWQAAQEPDASRKERQLAALKTLDTLLMAFPPEVRGRVGGFVKLASFETDAARSREIERRLEKLDVVVEEAAKKHYEELREKLFTRAKPKKKAGEKPKGKAGADVHDLFATLEDALGWTAEKAESYAAGLEAEAASGELSAEQEAHNILEAQLVRMFADWFPRSQDGKRIHSGADSARMEAAVKAATAVFEKGYAAARLQIVQTRERRTAERNALIADTGKTGSKAERRDKQLKDAGLGGWAREKRAELMSFEGVLQAVFGENSETARKYADWQRKADNQKEDAIQRKAEEVEAFFTKLAGGRRKGERLRWDLAQPTIDIDGTKWSQMELITATLMWRQADGRRHMEGFMDESGKPAGPWHYGEEWVAKAEGALSPKAVALREYLAGQYQSGWKPLNDVYSKLYGINLPQIPNYAPITVQPMQVKESPGMDPVTGNAQAVGSTPGGLKTRGTAVAEPDFKDALQVFIAHTKQMEHWKAYAEFVQEARAVFGNREVNNAVKSKDGDQSARTLQGWLNYFADGGARDAAAQLALSQTLSRMTNRAAAATLVGRIGTILVQATQLGAAAANMPTSAYVRGLSRLFTGRLGWSDAINSPYIQRRIKQMPPVLQQAMQGLGTAAPSAITDAARQVGQLMSGADGLFTAGTYAITYDYQLTQAKALGLSGKAAEDYAQNETERIVDRLAQPTRAGARSLLEVTTTSPIMRLVWSFASESRKNLGLLISASQSGMTSARFGRAALFVFLLNSGLAWLIRTAWRDLREDEDDDELWSPASLGLAMSTEWMTGIPVLGSLLQAGAYKVAGEWKPEGNLFSSTVRGIGAAERLPEMLSGELTTKETLRDVEMILQGMAIADDRLAALASFAHLLRDVSSLADNAQIIETD